MSGSLSRTAIIITGAACGQGAAEAELFVQLGARVAVVDIPDVAIAHSRLPACENGRVRFRWKDYREGPSRC
jgi:NAD(P)-dependent dehydrogenase (short-subunit alcohol dehydrogenase family)